jgi:CobQ-like glutamine amidotransferase family enzyme
MQFRLRLAHLYPRIMDTYGDRGNAITLRRRCEARAIDLIVDGIEIGDDVDLCEYDLLFIGGGQDREQERIAADLRARGAQVRAAIEHGLPALAVCGGYQLFGRTYQPGAGRELEGIGVFDMHTVHPGDGVPRCIGNLVAEWEGAAIVGFENHGGRTYLGNGAQPLARVIAGFGNNGEDGTEGARYGNAFGTYLHGSVLPKNPALADRLIELALERKYGERIPLEPLDDTFEQQAHEDAVAIAIRDHRRQRVTRLPLVGRLMRRLA